jgi:hypothetical protein
MPARTLLTSLVLGAALALAPAASIGADAGHAPAQLTAPMQLDWKSLLPENERRTTRPAAPPAAHDYLSEGDMVALQTGSFEPNREFEGRLVKIPGFVVPLERAASGLISEFLLVPYFGACIHLPPPPPNQVVYVTMRAGSGLKTIDSAMWVTGTLRVAVQKSSMGSAVYTLDGEHMQPYEYD